MLITLFFLMSLYAQEEIIDYEEEAQTQQTSLQFAQPCQAVVSDNSFAVECYYDLLGNYQCRGL